MTDPISTGQPGSGSLKPALIYCRVSTRGQEEDGTSLDSQEQACRDYAKAHGYAVASVTREVYSGAELWDRPLLSRDREALKSGQYAALICYDLDRLARNPVHQALLIEECQRASVALEIVQAPLDSSPEGMLIAYVRGYAAQLEREKIRERGLRGKRYRAAAGRIHNGSTELYGYVRDKAAGVRTIYEPEAVIVRRIYEWMAVEQIGLTAVARRLTDAGVPTPSAGKRVYRDGQPRAWGKTQLATMIRNPAYKGVSIAWHLESAARKGPKRAGVIRSRAGQLTKPTSEHIPLPEGVTPAIVSPELWQAAQDAIAARAARQRQRNTARFTLLRGMIVCARCGRRMDVGREHPDSELERYRYRCSSRSQVLDSRCGAKGVRADAIEAWVWSSMALLIQDPEQALSEATRVFADGAGSQDQAQTSRLRQERDEARTQIARMDTKQREMLRRFSSAQAGGADDVIFPWELVEQEVTALERQKRQRQAELDSIEARLTQAATAHTEALATLDRADTLRPVISVLSPQERRSVLESFSTRVYADGLTWRVYFAYPTESDGQWGQGVEFASSA